jgi:hypothetical protein
VTHDEFAATLEQARNEVWPRWSLPPQKTSWMYTRFRFATTSWLASEIRSYALEHADETTPRELWACLERRLRESNQHEFASPRDDHGYTEQERANIVRAIRLQRDLDIHPDWQPPGGSDSDVYQRWLRQEFPARFVDTPRSVPCVVQPRRAAPWDRMLLSRTG